MKRIVLVCLVVVGLASSSAVAQGGDVQIKIEQLIKLKVYLGWLEKGYQISQQGLGLLSNIEHGDFSLHSEYFTALGLVKSPVLHDTKIAAAFQLQLTTLRTLQACSKLIFSSGTLTPAEAGYLRRVLQSSTTELASLAALLTSVVTDGELNETDDQRIDMINRAYDAVLDLYTFSQSFASQLQVQLVQRQKAAHEISTLQSLHK